MARYYSQNGEDFILDKIFYGKNNGFFVEVGCIDGKRFSNTLHFEELGWKGICIEAHNDYVDLIKKNRPNSIVVHCAVGETDEDSATFYANSRGTLSTLDKSTEERWKKDYADFFTGFEEQKVNKRTLSTIFETYKVNHIDVLSVDVEGYEVEVLSGINLNEIQPKVIVVESDTKEHKKKLLELLDPYAYKLMLEFGGNLFFSNNPNLIDSIKDKKFNHVELVHTVHPLDQGQDIVQQVTINLNDNSSFRSMFSRLVGSYNSKLQNNKRHDSTLQLIPIGFHGDQHLINIVDYLMSQGVEYFIETGTNVGSTLKFVSSKYPEVQCLSCEPDSVVYPKAVQNAGKNSTNVKIFNVLSQDFIEIMKTEYSSLYDRKVLFWLDAHGYGFRWPLKEEIAFISKHFSNAYLLIDDFKVPHLEVFGYDAYDGQECSFDYIKDDLKTDNYELFYPNYTELTSKHHSLRGWGLINIGENLELPESLQKQVLKAK